jgi:hypothetical protein
VLPLLPFLSALVCHRVPVHMCMRSRLFICTCSCSLIRIWARVCVCTRPFVRVLVLAGPPPPLLLLPLLQFHPPPFIHPSVRARSRIRSCRPPLPGHACWAFVWPLFGLCSRSFALALCPLVCLAFVWVCSCSFVLFGALVGLSA